MFLLLVTADVPSSPILVTLIVEEIVLPKRWFLQEPHGVFFTAFPSIIPMLVPLILLK
jgi:hypothetical protein